MLDLNIIDATAELRLLRFIEDYEAPFDLIGTYRLIDDGIRPEATVTLRAGKEEMHEADLGVGPVDALANVLKKSLGQLFPDIPKVRLLDFKVRLIEGHIGTSSQIEVSVIFSDGKKLWKVSSVDDNVNLASFRALLDGYEYAIYLWSRESEQDAGRRTQKGKAASPGRGRSAVADAPRPARADKTGKGASGRKTAAAKAAPEAKAKAKSAAKVKPRTAPKTKAAAKSEAPAKLKAKAAAKKKKT